MKGDSCNLCQYFFKKKDWTKLYISQCLLHHLDIISNDENTNFYEYIDNLVLQIYQDILVEFLIENIREIEIDQNSYKFDKFFKK